MTETLLPAKLYPTTDEAGRVKADEPALNVQFNPETLEITARSKLKEETGAKQDKAPVQVVGSTERSMSVQLIFDQTLTGNDVRNDTSQIVGLMAAGDKVLQGYYTRSADRHKNNVKVPKIVIFEWGNFTFRGVIAEFNETLEYFSPSGVPLRASVKFTMQERDAGFAAQGAANGAGAPAQPPMSLPDAQPLPSHPGVYKAVKENGNEDARNAGGTEIHTGQKPSEGEGRDVGGSVRGSLGNFSESASATSKNGFANAAASLNANNGALSGGFGAGLGAGGGGLGGEIGLPAASIASGQSGFGAGAGLGLDAGVSVGVGFGGGVALGAGAAAGLGTDGGLDVGAFAGLKPPKISAGVSLGSGLGDLQDMADGFGGKGSTGADAGLPTIFGEKAKIAEKKVDLAELLFGEEKA
ncbi:MAG: hypothetical protein AAGF56_01635 [Pseudomonadota bacterium]